MADASYIRNGLLRRGLPSHVADAFIVNFQDESGLNPGINEANPLVPGSRGGFGLFQSTGPRRRALESVASMRGKPASDIDTQLDVLSAELGLPGTGLDAQPWFGSEGRAARSILGSPDTATAAQAIVNDFLRPAAEHRRSRSARYATLGGQQSVRMADAGTTMSDATTFVPNERMPSSSTPSAQTTGAAPMASNYGGLGGLGGAPAEPEQTGIRGFFKNNPGITDTLQAIGLSLMSSPNNAPLANVGQYLPGIQRNRTITEDRALEREQQRQDRLAMAGALQMAGLSPGEAQAFAGNSTAASLAISAQDARTAAAETNRTKAYLRQNFPDIADMVDSGLPVAEGFKMAADARKGTDQPASVREYEYAVGQGFTGSYAEWEQANRKAGATNINLPGQPNIGTIPPGYEAIRDEATGSWRMAPIPGGPAAAEAAKVEAASTASNTQRERYADVVTEDIDRALSTIDGAFLPTTGAVGGALSSVGGTAAGDLNALLTTIRTNVGFDRLQQMREASPTGGALGSVTENENRMLQSVIGNLEQSQSREQLEYNLNRAYNIYQDIVHGPGNGPARRPLTRPGATSEPIQAGGPTGGSGSSAPAAPPAPSSSGNQIPEGVDPAKWGDLDPAIWDYMSPEDKALFR